MDRACPSTNCWEAKARRAVDTYKSAGGRTFEELADSFQQLLEQGYRHIRCEPVVPGASPPLGPENAARPANQRTRIWEAAPFARELPRFFGKLRERFGEQVELLTDVHELLPPIMAIQLAKDLEPVRMFFLEDPLSPEDVGYFKHLRQRSSTPIAMESCSTTPTNGWTSSASG